MASAGSGRVGQQRSELGLLVVGGVDEIALDRWGVDPPQQLHQVPPRTAESARRADGEPSVELPSEARPQRPRNQVEPTPELGGEVARVAREDLVTAHAAQDHGEPLARRGTHEVGGDAGGVGDRLIHMPDQLREQIHDARLQDLLVIVGAELSSDRAGIADIVGDDVVAQVGRR